MSVVWRKPCEHGRYEKHRMVASDYLTSFLCPGGSSVTTNDMLEEVEKRIAELAPHVGGDVKTATADLIERYGDAFRKLAEH